MSVMGDMNDHEDDDGPPFGTDNNLFVKLRCKAFAKRPYDFQLTMKEFFEGMNIEEPLFRLTDSISLFIKTQSQDDKDRLLQLSKDEKDQWVLYKTPVYAGVVREGFEHSLKSRTFTRAKEGALDIILPHRKVPYETQLKNKVELLKVYTTQADSDTKTQLKNDKKIEKNYFHNIPIFENPIKSPKEIGFVSGYVTICLEYDAKKKHIEAGLRVFFGRRNKSYYFLPIKDCIHIAPPIISVVERFVEYLILKMDDLKEFRNIDDEAKTGFVNRLQCTVGDRGEVLLTVILSYYSDNEEFVPLEEIDRPISLKETQALLRLQQNRDNKFDEQMDVDSPEKPKTGKSKKPYWSSESGNPKGYKFVAQNFEDCHPSFGYFDFAQADSHLDVAVPFLREFYEENKEKLDIHGIYVGWRFVSRRPLEWPRNIRPYHHVCGEICVSNSVDGFPIHKFPFSSSFGPVTPNYGIVLEHLAKNLDVKKNVDLAISCEFRAIFLFFAKKCRNIIALNDMSKEDWGMAKNTKTRIMFTGHNLSQIDFAYRKSGVAPAALIMWGCGTRNAVVKRLIELGVERAVLVLDKAKASDSDVSKTNPLTPELTRINALVYPYLSLKRILPIDCDPGGPLISVMAFYEKNTDAPPLPPLILHKLDPELESKLPPTAIPPTPSKRAAEDDGKPDAKRRRDDGERYERGNRGGRGRGRDARGRGRDVRGMGGRGRGSDRSFRNSNDPEKSELLKQIEELKAQQEQLKKLLPGGVKPGGYPQSSSSSSSRGWSNRDGSRQSGPRSGARPDDSRRDVARPDRSGDRYVPGGDRYGGNRDRYNSRDRSDAPRENYDAPRERYNAPRERYDAPRGLQDASRDRYGGSDSGRYGYGSGSSQTTNTEKFVGSGYDYRNHPSSSDTYSSRYDAGSDSFERRDSSSRGRGAPYSSSGASGYKSAYGDMKDVRESRAKSPSPPPPPPPPLISRR